PISTPFPYTTLFRSGHFAGKDAPRLMFEDTLCIINFNIGHRLRNTKQAIVKIGRKTSPIKNDFLDNPTLEIMHQSMSQQVTLMRSEEHTSELQSREN